MSSSVRYRLALIAACVLLGAAPGCGDNTPQGSGQGGAAGGEQEGGAGAGGGASGKDGGQDGDARLDADALPNGDATDGKDAGDATDNRPDSSEAGDATDSHPDVGEAGDATDSHPDVGEVGGDATGAGGADGGAGTGAAGSDGGAGTGGAGTGGNDGGMDVPPEVAPGCYTVAFTKPVDQARLSAADDKDADNCVDGFQFDVTINTSAPNGTSVQLFAGVTMLGTVAASAGKATFTGVQFASSGDTNLSIQFPSTAPCTDATTKAKVTVDCSVPNCSITKPTISGAHPALNGVPTTLGGDRVSADGSPYQVGFEVTTNIGDNQTVALDINDATTPGVVSTVTARAAAGKATFLGVPLPPGATYQILARCIDVNGVVGRSSKGSYPVDATSPDLTISKPDSGDFIGPGGLTNGAFPVCGKTTSADAVNLSPALGPRVSNYCASSGGASVCAPATTVGVDTCVNLPCPGGAPFNITVTLSDAAGNPQSKTINGVTCSAVTPSVQIITPVTDAPTFTDPTRHLLAASAPQPFRDQNGGVAGAQTDVVACTSRGGTAALLAGRSGTALVQVATVATTAASALDGCPAGLGFVVKFLGVTLPESLENANGSLATATQIRVDVTDVSAAVGSSVPEDLWVDSVAPLISLTSPNNLCGSSNQAFATFDTTVVLATDTPNVTLTITNGGSTETLSSPVLGSGTATFQPVSFNQGQSNLAGIATDAAGNKTGMQPMPCTVTAGMQPVVIFTAPDTTNKLCASTGVAPECIDDADVNAAGWQGSITVHALVGGLPITTGNITFTVGGAPPVVAALDASGNATLNNVTLFDGDVTITAKTDDIPGHGSRTETLTIVVDLGAPNAPTNFAAAVLDRRQTSFQLSWTAPGDAGGPVAGYQVRYAKVPITAGNFDDAAVTTAVAYTSSPSPVGMPDGLTVRDLYIENDYYFAIAAVDAAGNRSALVATNAATTAHFNVTFINSPSGTDQEFGAPLDGSGDGNSDGLSDLLAGTSNDNHAYLFFGRSNAIPTTPDVTFTGPNFFGIGAAWIGDIDDDQLDDLAIADTAGPKVYIYKGRTIWPATLTDAQADYVISVDPTTYANSFFGSSISALGDFDGDGVDDFAIGAPAFGTNSGRVDVIYGRSGFTSFALPSSTRALGIGGDPALNRTVFGTASVGLGHFYSVAPGTTLIVSAPGFGNTTSVSNNEGRLYAFHGRGPGVAIDATAADNFRVGPGKAAKIGANLSNLGPLINGLPALGSGNPFDDLSAPLAGSFGNAFVMSGTAALGPFSDTLIVNDAATVSVGQILFGSGFSGGDQAISLIGNAHGDLVVGGQAGAFVDIIDGSKLASLTSPTNARAVADVHVPLPSGWTRTAKGPRNLIQDINGDTYPDFALGDQFGTVPGRVGVFW